MLSPESRSFTLYSKPRADALNGEQIAQIHMATLEVLERTGVQITHPRALELLHGAGARVTGRGQAAPAGTARCARRRRPARGRL